MTLYRIQEITKMSYKAVLKLVEDLEELGLLTRELDTSSNPPRFVVKATKKGKCLASCLS